MTNKHTAVKEEIPFFHSGQGWKMIGQGHLKVMQDSDCNCNHNSQALFPLFETDLIGYQCVIQALLKSFIL